MKKENSLELVGMMFKIFRRMKEEMSYTNHFMHLSLLQIQTLIFLHKNKKSTMSIIAEYFGIELPSATSLINKLCEQKLVNRFDDPEDRRLVRITLTDDGEALLEKAIHERNKKLEKILSYLSDKEKSELSTILKTLNSKMQ